MKYIIMLAIVVGLAFADFVTGLIKAAINHDISSQKMRVGGLHKIMEITVMATACGLEIGITALGRYYDSQDLSKIAGAVAPILVFVYILGMELISILENFVESFPQAKWAKKIVKFLRVFQNGQEDTEKEYKDVHSEDKTD